MIIVSDTSPISNLFIIHRLQLLRDIYGRIIIPDAVFQELMALKNSNFDLREIQESEWIELRHVKDTGMLKKYEHIIDIGESEAMVLAKELHAEKSIAVFWQTKSPNVNSAPINANHGVTYKFFVRINLCKG